MRSRRPFDASIPRSATSSSGHFLWVTFILSQQKKSDSAAGRRAKRPLRKRQTGGEARLWRYCKYAPLTPKGRGNKSEQSKSLLASMCNRADDGLDGPG